MDEQPGLSEQYRMASPWPIFIALGIPIAELGILFDLFPLAVGGLILFSGSVSGMLQEAGYVESPWRAVGVLAVVLVVVGVGFVVTDLRLVTRGYAIVVAGALLLLGAVAGELFVHDDAPAV
jgi:amino acid permease